MYAVIRHYRSQAGSVEEATRQVQEELLPKVRQIAGFVGYYLFNPSPQEIAAISLFESQAGAEESVRKAQEWVRQNPDIARLLPDPPQIIAGEVTLHAGQ